MLYPIVDTTESRNRGIHPVGLAAACFAGGARLLQVRDKTADTAAFLATVKQVVALARECGAKVIVNDRADLAAMARADGVHVGQEDLPIDDVRRIVGAEAIVGISTHDRAQVDAALASSASYVAVGPVFATTTKETGYEARSLDLVRYASGRGKPVVAIGGITLDRAPAVLAAGAWALAVITDLLDADDPDARVRAFLRATPTSPRSRGC